MAKDQIRDDYEMNFDFDPNDFEGFDLGSFDDPAPVTRDRNPVLQIGGSVVKGASKALQDTELQRSIIEKSLPEGYVRTYDAAIAAKSVMQDLHYDAKQSLQDLIKTTKNTIAPLSEKISVNLPEDMAKKINAWAASGKEDNYRYDPNEYKRMEMKSSMNEIFGGWEQMRDQMNADRTKAQASPDMATEVLNSNIQHNLLSSILEESSRIRLNSDVDKDFRENVLIKLQEKQIELGFKTLWAVTSVADIAKQHFDFDRAQMPKLVKNTGLPELVKEHNNEIALKLLKQKSMGGAVEMFGNSFGDIGGRIVRKTKQQVNSFFKEAVGMTMNASQHIQSMGGGEFDETFDPNESEEDRNNRRRRESVRDGLGNAAGHAAGFATNKYARKLGEKLRTMSENNPKVARVGMALSNLFDAMPNHINDALGGDKSSGSGIWDEFRKTFGLDELKWKDKTLIRGQSMDDLSTRAVYTVHEKRSITEIIPGWLARIHNEIRMHRTGMNDLEPMSWSFESNKFEDAGETATRIKKKFLNQDKFRRSGADLDNVMAAIDTNGTLTDEAREEIRKVLAKAAYDPSQRISLETLAQNDNLSADTQRSLRDFTTELQGLNIDFNTDPTVANEMRRDFNGTKEEQERRAQIYASMRNLRSGLPSNFNDALKYASAGEMEQLAKQGIVTQNDKGEWHYNSGKMSDELLNYTNQMGPARGFASGGLVNSQVRGGQSLKLGGKTDFIRQPIPGDSALIKKLKGYLLELSPEQLEVTYKYLKLQSNGSRLSERHNPWKEFHNAVPKEFASYIDSQRGLWNAVVLPLVTDFKNAPDGVNKVDLRGKLPANNRAGRGGPTRKSSNDLDLGGVTHANEFVVNADAVRDPGAKEFLNEFNSKGMKTVHDSKAAMARDLLGQGGPLRRFLPGVANNAISKVEGAIETGKQLKSFLPRIRSLLGKKTGGLAVAAMSGEMERQIGAGDTASIMLASEQLSLTRQILDRTPDNSKNKKDGDGDGLRDGSWQEQLKNKGKGKLGEVAGKLGEVAKDKPKSIFGFLGTLVTMVGGLATTVGAWLSKIWGGGKAILTAIKGFLQMRAANSAMDSLGDVGGGEEEGGRRRRRRGRGRGRGRGLGRAAGRAAGSAGGMRGAANVASKFGGRGKLVAAGLIGASMLPGMGGGEAEAAETEDGSDKGMFGSFTDPNATFMDRIGDTADIAMTGGIAAWAGSKVGEHVFGKAKDAVIDGASTAAMTQGGRGLMARGASMIGGQAARSGLVALAGMISAPVALSVGALALAGYGAYKLYKYMKSEKAYAGNWRMAQYGYSYKSSACEKISQLEAKCLEFITVSNDQPAQFGKGVKPEDLVTIFNIDINDKAAVSRWASWFAYRFKPVFLNAVTVYFKLAGNANIHEADDKLTDYQKKTFIEATNMSDAGSSPYKIMASPLSNEEVVSLDYSGVQAVFRDMVDVLTKSSGSEGEKEARDEEKAKKEAASANAGGKSWWEQTKEKAGGWMNSLSDGLKDTLGKVSGGASKLWDKATGAASNAWEGAKNIASDVGSGLAAAGGAAVDFGARVYDKLTGGTKANQLAVYKAFITAGFSKNQALALTAEVGRENGYQAKALWGGHIDAAKDKNGNRIANLGFISWNRERREKLIARARAAGVLTGPNQIAESQEGLNVMAKFVMEEMQGPYSKGLSSFMSDPNIDPESAAPILGKKYIGWAYGQDKLRGGMTFDWRSHDAKRRGYLDQIKQQVGNGGGGGGAPEKAGGGSAFVPYKPSVLADKAKANPLGNKGGAVAAAAGGFSGAVGANNVPSGAGAQGTNHGGVPALSSGGAGQGMAVPGNVQGGFTAGSSTNAKAASGQLDASMIELGKKMAVRKDAGVDLNGMNQDFMKWVYAMIGEYSKANGGAKVIITSAFRSKEKQYLLYYNYKYKGGNLAAQPGKSKHEFGIAIDIDGNVADRMAAQGLLKKYGFTRPLLNHPTRPERWHLEHNLFGKPNTTVQAVQQAQKATATPAPQKGEAAKATNAQQTVAKQTPMAGGKAATTALPASNGGTSYSSSDVPIAPSGGSSGGSSTSSTVSNSLGNANIERISNEQLKALNNMDVNLSKILQSLTRMEKNGSGLAQAAAQQQQQQPQSANGSAPNQQSNGNQVAAGVSKGIDSLFGPKTERPKSAPIDLRS